MRKKWQQGVGISFLQTIPCPLLNNLFWFLLSKEKEKKKSYQQTPIPVYMTPGLDKASWLTRSPVLLSAVAAKTHF